MRKRRTLAFGAGAGVIVAAAVVGVVYLAVTGSAGAAIAICLVGLGPALAAMALVGALSLAAPPVQSVLASTVSVATDGAVETQN